MHLLFSPPIGSSVRVSSKSPTQLHFIAATLDPAEHRDVAAGRVKVQLWSNLLGPTWSEADFAPIPPSDNAAFSLVPADHAATGNLALSVTVPAGYNEFSFTYRVLHPANQVEWLGSYGTNGTLVLEDTESNPVAFDKTWTHSGMGTSMIREARGQLATELEVAKIDASYEVVYPPGHSNLPVSNAELVILLPRQHLLVRSPTLVFSATSSGSISIDSTGSVKVSGDPSVSFTACESSDELHRALTSTRTNFLRTDDATLLASAAHIVIVPNTRSPLPQELSIPLGDLAAVSRSSLPLCLYSAPRRIAAFFSEDELVSIMVGPNGGHLLVVPMNEMIHDGQRWHVGIASPRSYSAVSTADVLPTPPPSPRLRPLTHRMSSNSPDPSFLNLSAQVVVPEAAPPNAVVKPHPNLFALLGYAVFALLGWAARLLSCWRRRKVLPQTQSTDERTPLLAEREPPVVHVVETPTSQPALSANVERGKVTILMHGATPPTQVRIQLDGKDVDKQMYKINDLCYATEFSSKSGGRLTVGC